MAATTLVTGSPTARADAARFIAQASFGPTDRDVDRVMAIGYGPWIDEQSTRSTALARTYVERMKTLNGTVGRGDVTNAIWNLMLTSDAQLRQRVAFALSEIFVISLDDGGIHSEPRAAAAYYDLLAAKGLGNFRTLLESVALNPLMGRYLSHLGNQKANLVTGRVPDENFAREVMQLFTIGLYELNLDGTLRRDSGGRPIETYGPDDVAGLAKVFTGWSWSCPTFPADQCFLANSPTGLNDADTALKSMLGYPKYHSTDEKRFLGVTIPAQSTANPGASLKVALDTLFNHPNVGPFIGKQLIQKLVSSNPSPQYVAAVAAAFNNNGAGVRGDMKAVLKAILLHAEARTTSTTSGKVREPILRLTAFTRAFPFRSISGNYIVGATTDAALQLNQTPLSAPSVFNFFRPGYVAPESLAAARGMVAPEMQLVGDTSAAGFGFFMRQTIERGVGQTGTTGTRDIQLDYSAELALADKPASLVARLNERLCYGTMPSTVATAIQAAIEKIAIPALASGGTNQATVDQQKRKRVNAALLITMLSPDFIVQK